MSADTKRRLSPGSSPTGKAKKIKIEVSHTTPNVPAQLQISALIWVGHPTTCCADGEALDQYVGKYKFAASSTLDLQGWDELHKAFEYKPSNGTIEFRYIREAYMGTASSDIAYYGAILASEMSPKIRVCAVGQNAWPDRIETDYDIGVGDGYNDDGHSRPDGVPDITHRPFTGPPFLYYECDFPRSSDEVLQENTLNLDEPDLPGQPESEEGRAGFAGDGDDEAEDDAETDSTEGLGWRGPWVAALLAKQQQRKRLGERLTETRWTQDGSWASDVKFAANKVFEYENEAGRPSISGYMVKATIERVFLTPRCPVIEEHAPAAHSVEVTDNDNADKSSGEGASAPG